MTRDARAFWLPTPDQAEIRSVTLPEPGPEVLIRTPHSGISRRTQTLMPQGGIPTSQHAAIPAPFQEGMNIARASYERSL